MATIVTRAGKGSPLTHDEVDLNFTNLNTDKLETSGDGSGLTNIARKVWESSQGSGSSANYWAKVATYSITGDFDDGTFIYHFMPEELGAGMPAIVAVNVRTNNASGGDSHTLNVELMSKPHATPFSDDSFKLIDNGGSSDIELWVKKNDNNCQISAYEMSAHVEDSGFTIAYNQNAAWQASEPTGSGLNIKTVGVKVAGNFTATSFAGNGSALTGLATAAQGTLADSAVQPNSSPALTGLTVDGTDTEVLITEDSEGSATLRFADTQADPSQSYAIAYDTSANKANFKINDTQRANFNASGDYMVGPATTDNPFVIYTANNDATKAGVGLRQTGYIAAARMSDHAMMLNRMGSDGLTLGIRNDGTFVGGLGNVGGELTFHDSTDAEAMRIDSSGSVGIGTTNPATALDVNGTVTADAATLSGRLTLPTNAYHYSSDGKARLYYYDNGDTLFRTADDFQFRNNSNATVAQIQDTGAISTISTMTATSFIGDGSALTGIAAGATGGGSDDIFYENGQNVTTNYTITNGKNAMSAGPITVDSGVTVTVGAGETWTVV